MASDRWTPKRVEKWRDEHELDVADFVTGIVNGLHEQITSWINHNLPDAGGEERALARVALAGSIVDAAFDLRTWQAALAHNSEISKSAIAAAAGLDRLSKVDRWPGFAELADADRWAWENREADPKPVTGRSGIPITVSRYAAER